MDISIFGLGYVGCVGLGCLSKNGHHVIGVDLDVTKTDYINNGKPTIFEKDIDELISQGHSLGRISATNDGIQAVKETDVSFMCVGTPSTPDGHLDLAAIFKVSEEIAKGIKEKNKFHIVVIRSTVLPGTNEKVSRNIENISGKKVDRDFTVVSNPEFLREGTAVHDYFNPSFSLIGSSNETAIASMKKLYEEIKAPIIITEIKTAELIKYVNNAFHALKITFSNEVGNICKKLGIESHGMMKIFCMDNKLNISPYYMKPGFAYGGSCLPKDLKALRTIAHDFYLECPLIESIEKSNDLQKRLCLEKILSFKKEKISFLGLSFKAGTDDLRNSPIIDIIEQLLGKGFSIKIYDKNVNLSKLIGANKNYILEKIPYISKFLIENPDEIIADSDVVVVVNKEKEFSGILERMPEDKIIYDLVNIEIKNKKLKKNYKGISW
jgi:GDP-mannose 6-dehydrogenase